MSPEFYRFLHIISVILLCGCVFYAVGAPETAKRRTMILAGIASLFALIGGFGLLAKVYSNTFFAWVIVKLVCWLLISSLGGLAFRRRAQATVWVSLLIAAIVVSAAMVAFKPGM